MSKEQQELNLVKHNIGATKGKRSSFQTATNVDDFLDKEKTIDDKKPWNKLNKMQKIQKLSLYVKDVQKKHDMTPEQTQELKSYLKKAIDHKKLTRIKDVEYDVETALITNIPSLMVTKQSPRSKQFKFTLKATEQKKSTLKNLGIVKKKNKKNKPIKIEQDK